MPLYIEQSGDLDRCYGCLTHWLTHWLTTLKDRATQLLIKYKSGALVTQCLQVTVSESELEESWRELNASAGFEFALLSSLRAAWLPSSSRFKPMTKKGALANLEETLKIRINLRNSKRNISSWMSLRAAWLPFSSRFKLMTKKKRHRILILRFGNNFDTFKGRSIR